MLILVRWSCNLRSIIMNKILLIPAAVIMLAGCAGPGKEHFEYYEKIEQSDKEVKLAIINGYYGKKITDIKKKKEEEKRFFAATEEPEETIADRLPLPEGSGVQFPCGTKCIADCSEECKVECPDMWRDSGCAEGDEEEPDPDSAFDWGEDKTVVEKTAEPEQHDSVRAYASTPGDNNNQVNVVGGGNKVLVQGGSAPNSAGANPIEAAMAKLLLRETPIPKTGAEITGSEFRAGLMAVKETALSIAPAVLTGVAIHQAADVISDGFKEAGGQTTVGGDMSGVSTAESGGSATAIPDYSTEAIVMPAAEEEVE
jgi:hypothetical protein